MLDQPMSTVGDVAMGLEVTFLNSAVDSVGNPPLQAFVLAPSPALQSLTHCRLQSTVLPCS